MGEKFCLEIALEAARDFYCLGCIVSVEFGDDDIRLGRSRGRDFSIAIG
jgi:hypothetical protein